MTDIPFTRRIRRGDADLTDLLKEDPRTRWSLNLVPETLKTLLWAIGGFANALSLLRDMEGNLPRPHFRHQLKHGDLVSGSLLRIAAIRFGDFTDQRVPSTLESQVSDTTPAFPPDIRNSLAAEEETGWAAGLSEKDLMRLLWSLGACVGGLKAGLEGKVLVDTYPYPESWLFGQAMSGNVDPLYFFFLFIRIVEGEPVTLAGARAGRDRFMTSMLDFRRRTRHAAGRAEGRPLKEIVRSAGFIDTLRYGKYSRWALTLDHHTLEALLSAVGVFGACISRLDAAGDRWPKPDTGHPRILRALDVLLDIQQQGVTCFRMPSGWDRDAAATPALRPEFAARLAENRWTRWAGPVSERGLGLILWMVGECGIRLHWQNVPRYSGDPGLTRPAETALALMLQIFQGRSITCAEAARLVGGLR